MKIKLKIRLKKLNNLFFISIKMSYDYDEFDANNFEEDYDEEGFDASMVSGKSKENFIDKEKSDTDKNKKKSKENDKNANEYDNDEQEYKVYMKNKNGKGNEEIDDEIDEEIMENKEEEEEEEEVIILDEDQKFSEEDIIEHAKFLGFDTENDMELLHLAKKALFTPLPKNWNRCFLKRNNRICYLNMETQSFNQYSPNDELAITEYFKAKKEKQTCNNQKEEPNYLNNKKSNLNNSQNNYNYSPISHKLTDSVNINNDIKNFLETDQDKKQENTEEIKDEIESNNSDILQENLIKDTVREERVNELNENKAKPSPYLALIKINSNKTHKTDNDDKHLKELILKEKFAELQIFTDELKKEYVKKKLNYFEDKKGLIRKIELEYEEKTKLELEKLDADSHKQRDEDISSEGKNEFMREIESFRKQCENELMRKQQSDIDKHEQRRENLLKQKSSLTGEIEVDNPIKLDDQ